VELVTWAAGESRRRLSIVGTRWAHSRAVASRAQEIAAVVDPVDRDVLVAAGYLHDIGHAPELVVSGFHPLDGARWLQQQGLDRLAGLVAHHTGAVFEAEARGLGPAMARFPDERSAVSDALTYSDLTTGPAGEPVSVAERLHEIERRYGRASLVVGALQQGSEAILATVERTEQRLSRRTHGSPIATR
jgi:HD domain